MKLKVRRDPIYDMLELYEFKMSLYDHGEPGEFLLFISIFNTNHAETRMLEMDTNILYLRKLFRGEALHHFDLFFSDVENIETQNVDYYTNSLAWYFPPVNSLSKQKHMM